MNDMLLGISIIMFFDDPVLKKRYGDIYCMEITND